MAAYGAEFFNMNEVNRLKVIQDVIDWRLTTHPAAGCLSLYDRHCRRLLQHYLAEGTLDNADRSRDKLKTNNWPRCTAGNYQEKACTN